MLSRKLTVSSLVALILVGAVMAFDQRFVSISEIIRNPVAALYYFAPTLLFTLIAVVQFRKKRIWPVAAFTIGLFTTGLFHQYVVQMSYGNPGYMFPGGHIIAPFVSGAAYLVAFLIAWIIARVLNRKQVVDSSN